MRTIKDYIKSAAIISNSIRRYNLIGNSQIICDGTHLTNSGYADVANCFLSEIYKIIV